MTRNGIVQQDGNTDKMIFTLAEQIAHKPTVTLIPATSSDGTPAGVGLARKEFLKAGDVVKVWV